MNETLRKHAVEIFLAGVRAADPREAVLRHLRVEGDTLVVGERSVPLDAAGRVLVVGGGKAAARMAAAVEEALGERLSAGLVVVDDGNAGPTRAIEVVEAGHPIPDGRGLAAAQAMASLLRGLDRRDLVLCLLSGGASALLPLPAPPVSLADKQAATSLLLASGADIAEINTVRKHLSLLKGGGLARSASPGRVVTLVLSDVVGDPLDVIASGPTVADPSTFGDALDVLARRRLTGLVPPEVLRRLREGASGLWPETPKPGDAVVESVVNAVVGGSHLAVEGALERARVLGYGAFHLPEAVTGEAREAGGRLAVLARMVAERRVPVPLPACVVGGGETTVTVRGPGRGGRNQEAALAAAVGIDGLPGAVILCAGTDGVDGTTGAAGAVVDSGTVARAAALGFDAAAALVDNDSHGLLERTGDLVVTGPTGTNVMDLNVVLVA